MASKQSKNFTFEYDGKTYEFEHGFGDVRKPGFIRKNREAGLDELTFVVLETVAGDEALDVIDNMDRDEWTRVIEKMWEAIREGE